MRFHGPDILPCVIFACNLNRYKPYFVWSLGGKSMVALRKVTMNLTDRDIRNTESLSEKLHTRSKAEAVSAALSITSSLSEMLEGGKELIIRNRNGEIEKVIIPGLTEKD